MARRSWFAIFCFAALIAVAAPQGDARRRVAPFQKGKAPGKRANTKPFKPAPKGAKGAWNSGKMFASKAAQKTKDIGASLFGKKPGFAGKAGKPKVPPPPAGKGYKSAPSAFKAAAAARRAAGRATAPKPKGPTKAFGSKGWRKPKIPSFAKSMPNMPKGLNDTQIKDIHERQEKQFKLMDADEDGVVTADEVSEVRRKLKDRQTEGESIEQFETTLLKKTDKDGWHRSADKNSDGHLTLDEFKFKKKEPRPQEL